MVLQKYGMGDEFDPEQIFQALMNFKMEGQ
jgi:hypothetical protein